MTNETLPAPLTPPECDLRGLEWMPLDVMTVIDSDLFTTSTGDEFKAAFALWCKSWRQVPAGSLPNDEKALAELSRAKNWKKVRDKAMHNWVLCSDGRYYHPVVSKKALEALPSRQEFEHKKTAEAQRKERERADRKALFALLREHGIVPPYDTKTTALRELAKPFVTPPSQDRDVTGSVTGGVTGGVTGHAPVTAKTGTGEGQGHNGYSVPYGTGGGAAGKRARTPEEARKSELWRAIKTLLVETGESKDLKAAGAVITKAIARFDEPTALAAIEATLHAKPAGPIAFLEAACQNATGRRPNKQQTLEADNLAAAQRFAMEETAP